MCAGGDETFLAAANQHQGSNGASFPGSLDFVHPLSVAVTSRNEHQCVHPLRGWPEDQAQHSE